MELWLRAGMTMKVNEQELSEFKQDPQQKFKEYVKEGKIFFEGETYFPDTKENQAHDMDEFDFVIEPVVKVNEI